MLKKLSVTAAVILSIVTLPLSTLAQVSFQNSESNRLSFTLKAGESSSGNASVVNTLNQPIDISLYATDGALTNTGTFTVRQKNATRENIGLWVHFDSETIHLEPREQKTVNFTIHIPSDTTPGSYSGGLSVEPISTTKNASAGIGATTSTRVVMPMYITVSGEKITKYTWNKFVHQFDKKHIFSLTISNDGNTILAAKGQITIEDSFGNKTTLPLNDLSLPRDNQNSAEVHWDQVPFIGFYTATAKLTFSEFDPLSHKFNNIETVSKTVTFNVIPWGFLGLVLLTILALITYFVESRLGFNKLLKSCKEYTVNENETLESIAKTNKCSWQKLAKINKLTAPYTLSKGQKILIPPSK